MVPSNDIEPKAFFRFNASTIQRFNESLSRHSFSTAVALCEGWLASAEALYERRIKREAKLRGKR
jgi:hypothetical protein